MAKMTMTSLGRHQLPNSLALMTWKWERAGAVVVASEVAAVVAEVVIVFSGRLSIPASLQQRCPDQKRRMRMSAGSNNDLDSDSWLPIGSASPDCKRRENRIHCWMSHRTGFASWLSSSSSAHCSILDAASVAVRDGRVAFSVIPIESGVHSVHQAVDHSSALAAGTAFPDWTGILH